MSRKKTLHSRIRKYLKHKGNVRRSLKWIKEKIELVAEIGKRINDRRTEKLGKQKWLKYNKDDGDMIKKGLKNLQKDWAGHAFLREYGRKINKSDFCKENKIWGYFLMVRQYTRNLEGFTDKPEQSSWNQIIYINETFPNLMRMKVILEELIERTKREAKKILEDGKIIRKYRNVEGDNKKLQI